MIYVTTVDPAGSDSFDMAERTALDYMNRAGAAGPAAAGPAAGAAVGGDAGEVERREVLGVDRDPPAAAPGRAERGAARAAVGPDAAGPPEGRHRDEDAAPRAGAAAPGPLRQD